MIFRILFKYILGYVNISVEGYYIERFINTCISKGIFLWNVKRDKSTYMRANVGIQEFKKLKQVAKNTKCKMSIEEKKGLPFAMHKYRKRKMFFILIIVIAISMYGTSKYVWNIQIEGLDKISTEEILKNLEESRTKCWDSEVKDKYK
ncbi:MAG: hypothetical protein HFJ54_07140 [Clostridia bacterium]|nr:hypothetical protein [Clostridia bacterium]